MCETMLLYFMLCMLFASLHTRLALFLVLVVRTLFKHSQLRSLEVVHGPSTTVLLLSSRAVVPQTSRSCLVRGIFVHAKGSALGLDVTGHAKGSAPGLEMVGSLWNMRPS